MLSQEELLLRDAAYMASTCTDIEEADEWASAIQSVFRRIGLAPGPSVGVSEVLDAAADHGGAAGAVLAAAIAVYGPSSDRQPARRLYRRLIDGGAVVPGWVESLGEVTPVRAVRLSDAWDDEELVWIDFVRPDGAVRGMGVEIDRLWDGVAHGFIHGPAAERIVRAFADEPQGIVTDITLADARARIEAGLRESDATVRLDDEDDDGCVDRDAFDDDLRALVDQRIGLLPRGGSAAIPRRTTKKKVAGIVAAFVVRPHEQDRDAVLSAVGMICDYCASCYDADPLRWSPRKAAAFLAGWIPRNVITDDALFAEIEAVFPTWLAYGAEQRGLDAELLEENLSAASGSFDAMRRNAADPSMRSVTTNVFTDMLADGIDPSDPSNRAAVQAWIDQYNARPRRERY